MNRPADRPIRRRLIPSALLAVAATAAAARAEGFSYKDGVSEEYRVPLAANAPTLDGHIEPEEWRGAVQIDGFSDDQRRVRGYVLATEDAFYLAVRSQLPDQGDLRVNVDRDNTSEMVRDDSVELWLAPPRPGMKGSQKFQFMTNPNARRWARIHGSGGVDGEANWEAEWETESALREDGYWHCESRIPVDQMTTLPVTAGPWTVNLWRNWKNPWLQTFMIGRMFDFIGSRWHVTEAPAPATHLRERADRFSGDIDLALELHNPSDTALTVKATLRLERDGGGDAVETRTVTLAPGASETVALALNDEDSSTCRLTAEAVDAGDGTVYFRHNSLWKIGAVIPWETPLYAPKTVLGFRCGYFPYANTLKVLADLRGMPEDARVERVAVQVRKQKTGQVILSKTLDAFEEGRQEAEWDMPADIHGFYEVVAKAEGENVPDETIVARIKRERFAWEHNRLGITDEVFPPFEPLEAEGSTVSPVLRTYRMNEQGLWDSVVAKGREMLAAPMRYAAYDRQGRELDWTGAVSLESAAPHEVVYRSRAACAAVAIEAESRIEMDGFMRVTLKLDPVENPAPLRRLSLEIPLVEEECYLMHQVHDAIRQNYAGRVPDGEGEIWNSKQIYVQGPWLNAFNGYLWLGGGERGLCWLAENDKGWITAKNHDEPLQRVTREDGRLVLRVDLVNVPGAITEPTELVFGVQASPTRPPLPHRKLFAGKAHGFSPVMAWGGMGECNWKQPWGNRWEVIDKLLESKVTGTMDREWFQAFEQEHDIPRIREGRRWSDFHVGIFERMTRGAGEDGPVHVYFEETKTMNKAMPEYHVFQDAWKAKAGEPRDYASMEAYRTYQDVGGGPGVALTTWPKSELDYLLSLMNEWFRRGVAVKYDNYFPCASDHPWTSAAYEAEDGRVQPAISFWQQRRYLQRAWNLLNHWRRVGTTRPLDIHTHMSTTQVIPWFSWSTINCDLEYSPDAYAQLWPDRFNTGEPYDPDFLLTETAGRQVGVFPYSFPLFEATAYPPEVLGVAPGAIEARRREWGMKAVHEIVGTERQPMRAFGYGMGFDYHGDRIKVWNYWGDDPPCRVDNDRVRWLLLGRPEDEKLLLVLQSWENKPVDVEVTLLPERIGFTPGSHAYEAFDNRRWKVGGRTMALRFDFPFQTQVIEFSHRAPAEGLLFADDFDDRFDFGWDYYRAWRYKAPRHDEEQGALRFAEREERVFKFMNLPDFGDAALSFSVRLDRAPTEDATLLSVAFPAFAPKPTVTGKAHGLLQDDLHKQFVRGGARLELIAEDGQLALRATVDGDRQGPAANVGRIGDKAHNVRVFSGADGRYTVSVDGRDILSVDGVSPPSGNAFGFMAGSDVGRKVDGVWLDDVLLQAGTVDPTRLETARREAIQRTAEHNAALRDDLLEGARDAFGPDGSKALRGLAYFNRAEENVAALLDRLAGAQTDAQRLVLLRMLARLPEQQQAHVETMRGIGQPAERVPEFRRARAAARKGVNGLMSTLDDASREFAASLVADLYGD